MMSDYPSQEMDRFNVRLPAGMREAIAKRAKENGRSMNSEIVQILDDALNNKHKYVHFDLVNGETIEIKNVEDPEKIVGVLTDFAKAMAQLNKT
jgi:hypothetical protein